MKTHAETPSLISSSSSGSRGSNNGSNMKNVQKGRDLICLFLTAVAAILGIAPYLLLTNSEELLAETQFYSFAQRALQQAVEIAERQRMGIVTMASLAEQTFPGKSRKSPMLFLISGVIFVLADASTWPVVNLNGFHVYASNLVSTSAGKALGLASLVTPEEKTALETFATTIVFPASPHREIIGLYENFAFYNDTTGEAYWGGPYTVFSPFLFHSVENAMFVSNYHSIESRGQIIDDIIACSQARALTMNNTEPIMECSVLTDVTDLRSFNPVQEPAAVAIRQIYPANNNTVLAGTITSKWADVLNDVCSSEVSRVDCVLATENNVFTYHITKGQATLKDEGDLHNRHFSKYQQSVALTTPGLYSDFSALSNLTVYPDDELLAVYTTTNPVVASVGCVLTIVFTSLLFILYDYFVQKKFHYKDVMFKKAKRQFVRFISHEVRTPLIAVCMGLQLFEDELKMRATNIKAGPGTATTSPPLEYSDTAESSRAESMEQQVQMLSYFSVLSKDVFQNARSAVEVVNALLNYDKVESGTLELELAVVSIWEVIEHISAEFRQQARFKDIRFELDFSGALLRDKLTESEAEVDEEHVLNVANDGVSSAFELPEDALNHKVIGDTARISQVLLSLIGNAIKVTPEKRTLTIRTLLKRTTDGDGEAAEEQITLHSGETKSFMRNGTLEVQVIDSGVGMTRDQLKHVFGEEVQFDVNELQAGQGSGQRLCIAKGFLEQHGGSLTADSVGTGCGTKFTMMIPLYFVPDPHENKLQEHSKLLRSDSMNAEPLNILVVDEAAMNRKLLVRMLTNRGHTCEQAEDGLVAVNMVEAMNAGKCFDPILMDYEMPNMDGLTACRRLRDISKTVPLSILHVVLILLCFHPSNAFVFLRRGELSSSLLRCSVVRYSTEQPQQGPPCRRQKTNKYSKFSKAGSNEKDPLELMIEESEQKLRGLDKEKNQKTFSREQAELKESLARPVSLEFPDSKSIDPSDPTTFGYTEVAVIVGAHGAKGQVKVKSTTDFPTERLCTPGIRHLRPVQKRAPRRIALVEGKPSKDDEFILRLDGVNTRDEAKRLRGATLYIREEERRSVLIEKNNRNIDTYAEEEFFVSDLVGMEVFLEQDDNESLEFSQPRQFVGNVVGVVLAQDLCSIPGLGHDMLELRLPRGKGGTTSIHDELVLVPFVPQIVPRVDMEERAIHITPPDGLLDLTYVREERTRIKGFLPSADD